MEDERSLGVPECLSILQQLLVAGNETTADSLCEGMLPLVRNPAQRARVEADADLVPNLVEEILRMAIRAGGTPAGAGVRGAATRAHGPAGRLALKRGRRSPDRASVAPRNTVRAACLILAAHLLVGTAAGDARAQESCDPTRQGGPVFLLIVQGSHKVREFAATVRGARVVRQDASTVIFSDGRVVTADVESASRHLNALNWGRRRIEVVASFPRTRPARRRAVG